MDTQDFRERLLARLGMWAGLNLLMGAWLIRRGRAFWRGFGTQAMGWGMVNGLLAQAGRIGTRRRAAALAKPPEPEIVDREARGLKRLLLINAFLDLLYLLGGLQLIRGRGATDAFWRGSGWGVVYQASFLFFFDLAHARKLERGD